MYVCVSWNITNLKMEIFQNGPESRNLLDMEQKKYIYIHLLG